MKKRSCLVLGLIGFVAMSLLMVGSAQAREVGFADQPPWRLGLNGGVMIFEGDEPTANGFATSLRLGYDYSPRWTFEGVFNYIPNLSAREVLNWERGFPERRSELAADSTSAYGLAFDTLYHLFFLDNRHWDPYLIGGVGFLHFDADRKFRDKTDITLRYGVGLAYHFDQEWSIRADLIGVLTAEHTEFNIMPSVGVSWRWGAQPVQPQYVVSGTPKLFTLYIEFETDKAVILPESFKDLDMIGETLYGNADSTARIEGHADRRRTSSAGYNLRLSDRRAHSVADYLSKNWGIDRDRMEPVGFGFSRPVAPNDPVEGNNKNRRVEIYIFD